MEITWIGHSCFRIKAKEATVVTDPCGKGSGYALGRPTADLVTVSNADPAHDWVAGVAGEPRVIDAPGEYEIAGVSLWAVATAGARPTPDATPARNLAFVFELDDMRICHLGALSAVPTSEQVASIGGVDVLFVPVGGGVALEAAPAVETVTLLEPRLVIPMHYKTDADKAPPDGVDPFIKEMSATSGETHAKLNIQRSQLPDETQVMVLEYKR